MPAEQRLLNKLVAGEIGFWISSMLKAEETPVLSRDKTVIRCVSAVKSEKGARRQYGVLIRTKSGLGYIRHVADITSGEQKKGGETRMMGF